MPMRSQSSFRDCPRSRKRNLDSFIPDDQQEKLKLIANAAAALDPALKAEQEPAASDSEDVAALKRAAKDLRVIAGQAAGSGQDAAHRLAKDLDALADGTAPLRQMVAATFLRPLQIDLQEISQSLHPQPITRSDLPTDLVGAWTAQNGLVRTVSCRRAMRATVKLFSVLPVRACGPAQRDR